MSLIYEGSKGSAPIDMALRSFVSLYTEDDFEEDKKGALKFTKGTFLCTLEIISMSINQTETINHIVKLLWTI